MALSIGEKIKELRKEMKLTQTGLAGTEMTKSMLSQIENNIAMPSMKNLQYIAERLNRPVSYFLDEKPEREIHEVSLPMDEISLLIKDIDRLMAEETEESIERARKQLEELINKYEFNKRSKTYSDINAKLGSCLLELRLFEEGEKKIMEAIAFYQDNSLYIDAARSYMDLMLIPWNNFDYEASMKVLERTEEIYSNSIARDVFLEIKLYHLKAGVASAMGDVDGSFKYIDKAIGLSNETNIHYDSDELYRLKAGLYLVLEDFEEAEINITKAQQFAEFTENKRSLSLILLNRIVNENRRGNPQRALEYLEKFRYQAYNEIFFYYYAEKSIALYNLSDYTGALKHITQVDYLSNEQTFRHKFDYLNLWNYKTQEGLILNKLGRTTEAIEAINMGIGKLKIFSNSKELAFAYKSLSDIYSNIGDYENAFKSLKKSDEIEYYLRSSNKKLY